LPDGPVTREELKTEILRRLWWDRFSYRLLLWVSIIAALAAALAAYEGRSTLKRQPAAVVEKPSKSLMMTQSRRNDTSGVVPYSFRENRRQERRHPR